MSAAQTHSHARCTITKKVFRSDDLWIRYSFRWCGKQTACSTAPTTQLFGGTMRLNRNAVVGLTALVLVLAPHSAHASIVAWEYAMRVHGSAVAANPLGFDPTDPSTWYQEITIPHGTPMTVTVWFDTNTPSVCPDNPNSGVYLIGIGNDNRARVQFLGYEYSAGGGIELFSFLGACNGPGIGLRLFVGGPVAQIAPDGIEISWASLFGNMFLPIPPSDWLGDAWPSGIPRRSTPFGGAGFIPGFNGPWLVTESFQMRAVPEPGTVALLGGGMFLVAILVRRRRH
jgi:hypothetical protein